MAKYLITVSEFKRAFRLDASSWTPISVIELMEGREDPGGILEALGLNIGTFITIKYEPNIVSILKAHNSKNSVRPVVIPNMSAGFDWANSYEEFKRLGFPVIVLTDKFSSELDRNHCLARTDLYLQYEKELNRFSCLKHRGVPTIGDHYCYGHLKTLTSE